MRVKGIKRYRKGGRWYCYYRVVKTDEEGKRREHLEPLKQPFGTAAFFAELKAAEERWAGKTEAKPGTLGMAIALYKASSRFTDLAPRTQSDYQKIFDYLQVCREDPPALPDKPLATFSRGFMAGFRDEVYAARGRRLANYVLSVLSQVFSFAAERGLMHDNVAKGVRPIRRPKAMPKANRPWTEDERETVLDAAPAYLKVPIAIAMFTGMREGDVIRLARDARVDGWLTWKTGKTGSDADWPLHSRLAHILDAYAADAVTMCVNSRGRPWKSQDAFRGAFFTLIRRLEQGGQVGPGLTFHGLRHSVGALLKEDGASDEDIALALGHKTVTMARHYSAGANRRKRMTASVIRIDPLRKGRKKDDRQLTLPLTDDPEEG